MRPGDEIRLVKENLGFAVSLWKGAVAGRLPPDSLLKANAEVPSAISPGNPSRRPDAELAAELIRGAANQMRAGFALSALQAQRSLETAFPSEPIREEWPELRAARCSVYLIARAVERSILQPVWECPPPYRRAYQIRRLGFALDASRLQGQVLSWDDFGGLERYLALLEYCAASANAAFSAGDTRTLPKHTAPSQAEFGGVIGSPEAPSHELAASSGRRPPRGYPGDRTQRLPPTVPAPPLLPEMPVEIPEDKDPWEPSSAEKSGHWHADTLVDSGDPVAAAGVPPTVPGAANVVRRFVDDRCNTGDDSKMLAGELYRGYLEWCQELAQQPVSQRAFGLRLTEMGFRRKRRGHGKHWWEGLRLRASA